MWYRKAAEQNHTKAMLRLGAMLHDTQRWRVIHLLARH